MQMIQEMMRKPLAKILTRAVVYGLGALLAVAGVQDAQAEAAGLAAPIAEGLAGAILLIAGALLDRWHHRKDLGAAVAAEAAQGG